MRILVVYASTEGQTRKVCRFAADHLFDEGHMIELLSADDAEGLDPGRFDAAILAGSVHSGRVQEVLLAFGKRHAAALEARPTLYLQVSLSAAGDDPSEHVELERIVDGVAFKMGWRPGQVAQVAGAFRFGEYDFFQSWAMRYFAQRHGKSVDTRGDTEFTDWDALRDLLNAWVQSVAPSSAAS